MKILNRYILKEFMIVYTISLIALSGLFLIVNIFENLKFILSYHPSFYEVFMLYFTQIPGILYQTIPMAALLTTVIVFAVMSKNNEIGSLLSTGINPLTIVKPIIYTVIVISIINLVIGESIVPRTNIDNGLIDANIHNSNASINQKIKLNNIWLKSNNKIYKIGLFIPWLDTIKDVTVYDFSNDYKTLISRTDIEIARWEQDHWEAANVNIRDFKTNNQVVYSFITSTSFQFPYTIKDFKHTEKTPDEMNYFELMSYTQKLKKEGYSYAPYDVSLNFKLSYPFSSLFVILIVLPFSLKKRKTVGFILAIGIALTIGFSYWIILALSLSMGNSGILNPVLATWLPNAITLGISTITYTFTKW